MVWALCLVLLLPWWPACALLCSPLVWGRPLLHSAVMHTGVSHACVSSHGIVHSVMRLRCAVSLSKEDCIRGEPAGSPCAKSRAAVACWDSTASACPRARSWSTRPAASQRRRARRRRRARATSCSACRRPCCRGGPTTPRRPPAWPGRRAAWKPGVSGRRVELPGGLGTAACGLEVVVGAANTHCWGAWQGLSRVLGLDLAWSTLICWVQRTGAGTCELAARGACAASACGA